MDLNAVFLRGAYLRFFSKCDSPAYAIMSEISLCVKSLPASVSIPIVSTVERLVSCNFDRNVMPSFSTRFKLWYRYNWDMRI